MGPGLVPQRVRVFLLLGFAFEALADPFQCGQIIGIEGIAEGPSGGAIALRHELHRCDGGDQDGRGQLLQRSLLLAQGFDLEALRLHGPKHLLDGPALAVEANDPPRGLDILNLVGGQKPPMRRFVALRRIDFARIDEPEASRFWAAVPPRPAWAWLGCGIATVPKRRLSCACRALRPGMAGKSTLMRPASGVSLRPRRTACRHRPRLDPEPPAPASRPRQA